MTDSHTANIPVCVPLREAGQYDAARVGTKCHTLGVLCCHGFHAPEGVCLTTRAFDEFLLANPHLRGDASGSAEIRGQALQDSFADAVIPVHLLHALDSAYEALCTAGYSLIVRSSSSDEDLDSASYSGIYTSIGHITDRDHLYRAVLSCWTGYWSEGAVLYRRRIGVTVRDGGGMALIIQQMARPRVSGVVATSNVRDGNPLEIMVTAGEGLGESVISIGNAGSQWIMDFAGLDILEYAPGSSHTQRHGSQAPILTERQLQRIAGLARRIDRIMGRRVEIEWAMEDGRIWCIQARPLVGLPRYQPALPWPATGREYADWKHIISPLGLSLARHVTPLAAPWPPEVEAMDELAGRLVVRLPENDESPGAFLERMRKMPCPEAEYRPAYDFLERWPLLTARVEHASARMLSYPAPVLAQQPYERIYALLEECLEVDAVAGGMYIGVSYPSYEYLRRVEYLCARWLGRTYRGDEDDPNAWAISLLQGAPKRTLRRDSELVEFAATAAHDSAVMSYLRGCRRSGRWLQDDEQLSVRDFATALKGFVARYGYSWVFRREVSDIAAWRSWMEDPTPIVSGVIAQAEACRQAGWLTYSERLRQSRALAAQRRDAALRYLSAQGPEGAQMARLFAACVDAADRCLPLKDERDLALAHSNSALRWILLALARKLVEDQVLARPQDIYLLSLDDVLSLSSRDARTKDWRRVVRTNVMLRERSKLVCDPHWGSPEPEEPANASPGCQSWQASGAAPGTAEGRCYLIESGEHLRSVPSGCILVVADEGMVGLGPYLFAARGVILESGNWLCHAVNLCRELGIPAIVSAGSLVRRIADKTVRMDGGRGTISSITPTGVS